MLLLYGVQFVCLFFFTWLYLLCFVLMLFLVWLLLYFTGVASSVCRFICFWRDREEGVEVICLLLRDQPSCSLEFLDILILPTTPLITLFLEVIMLFLLLRTHVYSAICDLHTLIADCNFLFDKCVLCT